MDQVLTAAEIDAFRERTPGCAHVRHFNHAGSSLPPQEVMDATIGFLQREAEIGGYEAEAERHADMERVYRSIEHLVGGRPGEIACAENATRAWDMFFYALRFEPGDRILTSQSEYASNVIAFLQVARQGVSVEAIPVDASGQVSVDALRGMLDERVKLVAISHMPTNGGLLQPASAIGEALRGHPAIYLLDACQTVGQVPVDVRATGCHALSATSRKYLRGPRGMGFLWVDGELANRLEPPMLDLHAARWVAADRYEIAPGAQRFENWERNWAGWLGMGAAADVALGIGLDRIWATVAATGERLRERLRELPGITVHDLGEVRGGIVTFSSATTSPEAIQASLQARSINTVTSSRFSTRYDMERRGLEKMVRASVHYLTTDAEIDQLVEAVRALTR